MRSWIQPQISSSLNNEPIASKFIARVKEGHKGRGWSLPGEANPAEKFWRQKKKRKRKKKKRKKRIGISLWTGADCELL